MDRSRWSRLWSLFHRAAERSHTGRQQVLAEAAQGEPSLAREVGDLLGVHDGAGPLDRAEAPPWPPAEDLSGSRLGPYLLERRLDEGGMGVVYRALQEAPVQRAVAVKLVRPGLGSTDVLARFEFERQALALMDDPRIATLLDAGAAPDGRPFFVMELVEGEPVTDFCDRRKLPLRDRVAVMAEVCEAVHHAHQKGVLHRDLKPSNVLVAERNGIPRVKVIDFGIAKALTADLAAARTQGTGGGAFLGTPDYMSPEQLRNAADVDTRSDVYALGMLLYRVLAGLLPHEPEAEEGFDAERRRRRLESGVPRASSRVRTAGARQADIARHRRCEPGALVRALQGELDWVLALALDPDRERRYGSAADLAADLRRHLAGRPVLAAPPRLAYRARKFVARHRWQVAAATALVAVLAGSVVILAAQRARLADALAAAGDARRRAEEQLSRAEAVSSFLARLFEGADPAQARGREVTARELVEAGEQRLHRELGGQPATRAALLVTLGEVWSHLGVHERAVRALDDSLELRRKLGDPASVAESAVLLGTALVPGEEWDRADSLIREGLELRRRTFGPRHPAVADALHRLGMLDLYRSRYPAAESSLQEALAQRLGLLPADALEIASTRNYLGVTVARRGRLEEAERLLRASLEVGLRVLPEDHPNVAAYRMNLADVLRSLDRLDESERLFRQALATRRRVFAPDHLEIAIAANNLAILLKGRGKMDEAEGLYREALSIFERRLGRRSAEYANTLGNIGSLRSAVGDVKAALALAEEALAIRVAILGDDHPQVGVNLMNLGWDLGRAGRGAEALRSFERALPILQSGYGADHSRTAMALIGLGWQLCEHGRLEHGAERLAEATAILARRSSPPDWSTGFAAALTGRCAQLAGRNAEARRLLEEGVALLASLPTGDQRRRSAEAFLAQARAAR